MIGRSRAEEISILYKMVDIILDELRYTGAWEREQLIALFDHGQLKDTYWAENEDTTRLREKLFTTGEDHGKETPRLQGSTEQDCQERRH